MGHLEQVPGGFPDSPDEEKAAEGGPFRDTAPSYPPLPPLHGPPHLSTCLAHEGFYLLKTDFLTEVGMRQKDSFFYLFCFNHLIICVFQTILGGWRALAAFPEDGSSAPGTHVWCLL